MNRTILQLTLAIGVLAASPATLFASLLATASASWTGVSCPAGDVYFQCSVPTVNVGESPTFTGTDVLARVTPPSPGEGGASSSATASYGFVAAYAAANSGVAGFPLQSLFLKTMRASSSASFDDTITVLGNGTGFMEATGSFDCCVPYDGNASVSIRLGTAGAGVGVFHFFGETPFDITTPFTFGVPLGISGMASADVMDGNAFDPGDGSQDGHGILYITKLIVKDSAGHPIAGFTYSTASGASYVLQDGVLAPEPGSWGLVLLGVAAVAAKVKGRRGRAIRE